MDRIEAIDYENFDRWQSINDLNCNDIDMSYVDKIRLYQYYDTTLHILCLLETFRHKKIHDKMYYYFSKK